MLGLLTISYYLLPGHSAVDVSAGLRAGGTVLGLVGAAAVIRAELRSMRSTRSPILTRIEALLTALYLLILIFATTYFWLNAAGPGQFDGIANRTDALYFTVTVVSTVGFGDIHAVGTAARLLVTVQMMFDLAFLGTALRALGPGGAAFPQRGGGKAP